MRKYMLLGILLLAGQAVGGDGMVNVIVSETVTATDPHSVAKVSVSDDPTHKFRFLPRVLESGLSDFEKNAVEKIMLGDGMVNLLGRQALLKAVIKKHSVGQAHFDSLQRVPNGDLADMLAAESIDIEALKASVEGLHQVEIVD